MKKTAVTTIIILLLTVLNLPLVASATSKKATREDGEISGCLIKTATEAKIYHSHEKVPKGTKLIVKEESVNGFFLVEFNGEEIYVNEKDVVVNIKDYIPSIDIQLKLAKKNNGVSFGKKKVPKLTSKRFYPKEAKAWVRYETVKKLLKAQKIFKENGYSIILYDAYRPYEVTLRLREAFYDNYLDKLNYGTKNKWIKNPSSITYLNDEAASHSYGVAVDIGLEKIKSGKELKMPSKLYSLDKTSDYSIWSKKKNKASKNALYMRKMMKRAGFSSYNEEWWHFEDEEVDRELIKLSVK